jgi:hypothetical protein
MKITRTSSTAGRRTSQYNGPRATRIEFDESSFEVFLKDGRSLRVPLSWFPRLERASAKQRQNYEWLGKGIAIHWPEIDEDISVEGLIAGNKAPRSKVYLTGKWPKEMERERQKIEAKYAKRIPATRSKVKLKHS